MSARLIIGDTRQVLRTMPDASVDLVLTSPPFLALRSYLPADHPDKALEMGSEETPGEFIDGLLDVVEECRRVLAPHGSIAFELGDTYSGSGGAGGDYGDQGIRAGQPKFIGTNGRRNRAADVAAGILAPTKRPGPQGRDEIDGWPMDKSMTLIPESFRWALAYGRNPFTGRETPRWRVRNVVRWCRPNPPVGALGDKFRPATSELVIATMARDRYFDLDAVRTDPSEVKDQRIRTTNGPKNHADPTEVLTANYTQRVPSNPAGAPPLDWWKISTQGYPGSHYATFPEQLCVIPIKAMVPHRVCTVCGEPSRRVPVENPDYAGRGGVGLTGHNNDQQGASLKGFVHVAYPPSKFLPSDEWTDCGHGSFRNGIVLDPFAGSGTTLAVATGHGRDAIGIDLDQRNAELALERVGPLMLTIEDQRPARDGAA